MTKGEIDRLATYNRECAHGLIHTPEYDEIMKLFQEEYNKTMEQLRINGGKSYASIPCHTL